MIENGSCVFILLIVPSLCHSVYLLCHIVFTFSSFSSNFLSYYHLLPFPIPLFSLSFFLPSSSISSFLLFISSLIFLCTSPPLSFASFFHFSSVPVPLSLFLLSLHPAFLFPGLQRPPISVNVSSVSFPSPSPPAHFHTCPRLPRLSCTFPSRHRSSLEIIYI